MKKSINDQIAQDLIEQLEAGNSPFQKPGFMLPVNPTTGKNYRGMTALQLALLDKTDPRYMTLRQASNANWKIEKGSKGILINFLKTQDRVKLMNDDGSLKMNTKGKPMTQLIKLEKPVPTNAFVFHAEQIKDIPTLAEFLEDKAKRNPATSTERLAAIGEKALESVPELEIADLPEMAVVQELVNYAGIQVEEPLGNAVAEEMRATIATMIVGQNLGLQDTIEPGIDFEDWAELLKEDPTILDTIVTQAQYIADDILKLEPKKELAQAARAERSLQVGDVIPYNESTYEILAPLAKKALQVQDQSNGAKFRVSPGDGIYNSLLQAKKTMLQENPTQVVDETQELEQDNSMQEEHEQEQQNEADFEFNMSEENERSAGRGR